MFFPIRLSYFIYHRMFEGKCQECYTIDVGKQILINVIRFKADLFWGISRVQEKGYSRPASL